MVPPSTRPSLKTRRPSMMSSLRNLIVADNDNDNDNDEDNDEDFIFTDQAHQRQEFKRFSETLTEFGLIVDGDDDNSGDDEKEENEKEDSPLLDQNEEKDKEDDATTKIEKAKEKPNEQSSYLRPYRRESTMNAYHHGQKESFLAVLNEIDKIQNTTRKDKGFKEWKFTLGLMNCLLVAYVFGCHPEHFWILYAIETVFWMSYKFNGMYFAKPLCEALYYLDFCWVMNTLGVTLIVAMIVLDNFLYAAIIPIELRKQFFVASFGVFCGPVFMAAMTLPFVAFLFHDVNTMANLIIHLMPSMVMYHHRWHAVDISAAYPTIFPHLVEYIEELNSNNNPGNVARITLLVYFAWFIPYTVWMLLVGLKLPVVSKDKRKPPPIYDTVFHSTWKGGLCELIGTAVWKRSKACSRDCSERNDYEIRDFLLYMTGHAVISCGIGIILLGDILCYSGGKTVHASLLWLATIICAKRGADRYTYYVTTMYGQKLRKAFRELENQQQKQLQNVSDVGPKSTDYGSIEEKKES